MFSKSAEIGVNLLLTCLVMCCPPFPFFRLPDGLTRRGDINLLMLGDPGTAKSQLLKFVERCSPIGVSIGSPVLMALHCTVSFVVMLAREFAH